MAEEGYYTITGTNTIDMSANVYENNFTLFNTVINKMKTDDNYQCQNQFRITLDRPMNSSLILIVMIQVEDLEKVHSL